MTKSPLLFARSELRFEISARSHPMLREELYAFCEWSELEDMPTPFVTGLGRDPEKNKAVNGNHNSWHLFDCAMDLRSRHYTAPQLAKVIAYWEERKLAAQEGKLPMEFLYHDAGTGSHVHVAVRDPNWKATYLKERNHGS